MECKTVKCNHCGTIVGAYLDGVCLECWQGRALAAEAENTRLREELEQAKKQINNFLTYGQGGAGFNESQLLDRLARTDAELAAVKGWVAQLAELLREIRWDISEGKEFKGTEHGRIRRDQINMVLEESSGQAYANEVAHIKEELRIHKLGDQHYAEQVKRLKKFFPYSNTPGPQEVANKFLMLETASTRVMTWFDRIYPPDVFTGESGDEGAVEVVAIRELLKAALEVSDDG